MPGIQGAQGRCGRSFAGGVRPNRPIELLLRQDIYSTGQVAALCGVSARTTVKWIDSGALRGYRIPGCMDRRVLRSDLLLFLREYHMPQAALLEGALKRRLLLVGLPDPLAVEVARLAGPAVEVLRASGGFEAGLVVGRGPLHAACVDTGACGLGLTLSLARAAGPPAVALAALVGDDGDGAVQLTMAGCAVMGPPYDPAAIAALAGTSAANGPGSGRTS